MVLRVPGGEQCDPLALRQAIEVRDFRKAGGWRLFEQALETRFDTLASDRVARLGRGGDGDGFEAFDGADQLAPVGELLPDALPRPARGRDQFEAVAPLNRGDMLVFGDLAVSDDGDADRLHDFSPAT
jgi:hypothetical protein